MLSASSLLTLDKIVPLRPCSACLRCIVFWAARRLVDRSKPRRSAARRFPRPARAAAAIARRGKKQARDVGRLLEKATPNWPSRLQPKTEEEVGKLKAKLNYAGFRSEAAPSVFLGLKIIGLDRRLLRRRRHAAFQLKAAAAKPMMYTVGIAGIAFYLPDVVLCGSSASAAKTTSSSACPMRST